MKESFVIKRKDFKKLERYAENIYNTVAVIDYFLLIAKGIRGTL